MKFSSLLFTTLVALSSGHYVDEQPESRYEEPSNYHVRSHHTSEEPAESRYNEGPSEYEVRSSHHKSDVHERTHQDSTNSNNLRGGPSAGNGYAHGRSGYYHGTDSNEPRAGEGRSVQHDVLIIGAGAAGLSAAHELEKHGWTNYKILEASDKIGGRTRHEWSFGENDEEYNIDLGAQYIHTTNDIGNGKYTGEDRAYNLLQEMVSYPLEEAFKTTYTKKEFANVCVLPDGGCTSYHDPPEYRWAGKMGWHSFLTEYVAYDAVRNNVINNCEVKAINTQGDGVSVTCGGTTYTAWYVIVTVPMKMLQKNTITFTPSLPSSYTQAINKFIIGNGFKVWIEYQAGAEYKEYFTHTTDLAMYRTSWDVTSPAIAAEAGYRLFWNEGYPYGASTKIVGGLIYGKVYNEYDGLSSEQKKKKIAEHLEKDGMVYGTPTGRWTVMDWKEEDYIEGAYTIFANEADQSTLLDPISSKLYFAGEALNEWTWGTVHGAAKTGRDQAKKIVAAGERRRE
ncbi:unnamed protein product [Cylindrotheca closterium]|uniref:Amine oxidase domain-containing protein n=1 Tax=Cylindrotheca closterium TaxID=2856 RepID=A0AAD2GBB0_9STRA|nr:unnamed protein product [Cylindrotheca closterium]